MAANEVCKILSYSNTSVFMNMLETDERRLEVLPTRGGPQKINFISESGLYTAIFHSQVPKAADFKRWVTRVVLPEIRRTGQFKGQSAPPEPAATLQIEDIIRAMLIGRDDGVYVAATVHGKFKVTEAGKYAFITAEMRTLFDIMCLFFSRAYLEFLAGGIVRYAPPDAPELKYLQDLGITIGSWLLPTLTKMADEAILPPRQMEKELKDLAVRASFGEPGENPSIVRLKQQGIISDNGEGGYIVNRQRLEEIAAAITAQPTLAKH